MDKDLEALEREFERQWESLGLDLTAEPSPAVVQRVRAAVRHELNEAWLAQQPTPGPSAAALSRVLAAVRRELARVATGRDRAVHLGRWLTGGAAAAAAVILTVGLMHRGAVWPLTRPSELVKAGGTAADEAAIERFLQAADRVWADDPLTRGIRDDLETIEENVTQWSAGDAESRDPLDEMQSQLDRPAPSRWEDVVSDAGRKSAGAFG
jgi:hypothetical protein